ncbi:MAG: 50S ribosomal protein L32 [Candidatus Gracilibacteria bacterium]|jgi:large subunit ribosomal protein L32
MAKHPVPKRKTPKAKTRQRYGAFKTKTLTKLANKLNLVACKNCGEKKPSHQVCPDCGMYKGIQIIDKNKKIDKITKIKA